MPAITSDRPVWPTIYDEPAAEQMVAHNLAVIADSLTGILGALERLAIRLENK